MACVKWNKDLIHPDTVIREDGGKDAKNLVYVELHGKPVYKGEMFWPNAVITQTELRGLIKRLNEFIVPSRRKGIKIKRG